MSVNLGRVAYVEKGAYDNGTTYQKKDVVFFNNGSFVFIADAPAAGIVPTDSAYWQPMLDPTSMNQAAATANQAAETANQAANAATTAANAANTAAEAADEARLAIAEELNKKAPAIFVDASGEMVHITDGAAMPVQRLVSHIAPVQSGSGDPSPDNVRPISGWDAVTLVRAGRNLLRFHYPKNEDTNNGVTFTTDADGRIYANGTANGSSAVFNLCGTGNMLNLIPGVKYRFGGLPAASTQNTYFIRMQDTTRTQTVDITGTSAGFTPQFSQYYVFIVIKPNVAVNNIVIDPMLTFDSGAFLPFESPHAEVLTANLPETVYGGTLNWTAGQVTVTHKKEVISSMNIRYTTVGEGFNGGAVNLTDMKENSRANGLCETLKSVSSPAGAANNCIVFGANNQTLYAVISSSLAGTTKDEFNAYLAENPLTVVYPLAEPYTIQLTPQQLETLKGVNNIWSDAGATDVAYIADTKMYADAKDNTAMIGTAEPGMIATRNYASGDFIVVGKSLYKATAAIATGEAITPGTNCTATTVVEQLAAIYNLLNA